MRRFLTISSLETGGAERVLTTLANAWAEAGHDVTLATTHDDDRAPHFPLSPQVRLRSASVRGGGVGKQLQTIRRLRGLIRAEAPEVVVSFLNYTNVLTLLACRGLAVPVVVSERADPRLQPIGAAWSLLRRIAYRRAACLVVQTTTAARLYEPLAPGRVCVVPNPAVGPVEAGEFPRDGRTILAVGRLHRLKGFDIALRAMAALPPEMANWRLVVLGEGPARAELEALRGELGLQMRVELAGQVADPTPWLRTAEIFLLSSRAEGFPNVLCEAMAAGLPAVATDCPSGPADIVTPAVDGLLVPAEDPAAMADALARLIAAPELRRQLGARAPGVLHRFSLPAVLAAWEQVLARAVGGERC
jgi:GalNAc-alpha-(1->4)-GalNAc-alpha-(1->3)-diNAcBac-PP-undecaprenol alpha-1,4-N-acetyl-D-galactosaminyltransferase